MSENAPHPHASPAPERVLVKGRHGYFMVLAQDWATSRSLIHYGEAHESEWRLIKRFIRPKQVAVDVGANMGAFLVPLAQSVGPLGHVIGFEPQPVLFECLQATVLLNKFSHVTLHPFCAGAAEGETEVCEPDYGAFGNFGGMSFTGNAFDEVSFTGNRIRARIRRLDDVLDSPRLDFIKIDVEGMERDVLLGASESIRRHRPVMFIENNRLAESPALIATLMEMGYRMWWHSGRLFNPQNFNGNAEDFYGVMSNTNMLCLPIERDAAEVPPRLTAVSGPDDHIMNEKGHILRPSYADDEPHLQPRG